MAEQLDLIIKNGTVVLGTGQYKIDVGIKDGKVAALSPAEFLPSAKEEIDASSAEKNLEAGEGVPPDQEQTAPVGQGIRRSRPAVCLSGSAE